MSKDITLSLDLREQVGKGLNKLKNEGIVPAVIHNHGKDSIIVSGTFIDLVKVYNQAGKHHPVNVKVGNETYLTIIKEADFDPKKNRLRHVVFSMIEQNETVETEVAVVLEGDSPAAKLGLVINQHMDVVKIEALPRDLPDSIIVNIESLKEAGDRINIGDIKVPNGITILADAEHPVVIVEEKVVIEEEEVAEEPVAAETPATPAKEE